MKVYKTMIEKLKKIQIEPTNRCNAACVMCRRTYWQRPLGDMDLNKFIYILNKIPECKQIHLQGVGEPFLNSDIIDMIKMAKNRNIIVSTVTNGTLFDNKKFVKNVIMSDLDFMAFSIDTINEIKFSSIRRALNLKHIINNLNNVIDVRNDLCSKMKIAIVSVLTNYSSYEEIIDLIYFAEKSKIDLIYFQHLNVNIIGYEKAYEAKFTSDDIIKLNKHLSKEKYNIKILLPEILLSNESIKCKWPYRGTNITWDGYVTLCCLQPDPSLLSFGNIYNDSFFNIWNSLEYKKIRSDFQKNKTPNICNHCPALYGEMWNTEISL